MKLRKIISDICELSGFKGDNEQLFYYKEGIGDKENKKSDFFYFLQIDYQKFLEMNGEDFNKNIVKLSDFIIDEEKLGDLNAFNKNLSMFIFVKLDENTDFNDNLKKHVYRIEEDGYSFNKFVICYKESQIEDIDDISSEMGKIKEYLPKIEALEIWDFTKEKFIFDLVCGLSFYKIKDFGVSDTINKGNKILENTQTKVNGRRIDKNSILKDGIDLGVLLETLCNEVVEIEDFNVSDDKITSLEEYLMRFGKDLLKDNKDYVVEETLSDYISNSKQNEQL